MLVVFFWLCLGFLLYCYFGYPLLLYICSAFKHKHVKAGGGQEHSNGGWSYPFISLLIPAYNEEEYIEAKIANTMALQYPRERLEVLLVSDGSNDGTAEIMRRACATNENMKFFVLGKRRGQTNAINIMAAKAKGEVLVFSDANVMLNTEALLQLARHYKDGTVGGVCGNLVVESDTRGSGGGTEALYKRYDQKLKELESLWGCVASAEGSLHSVRKDLFEFFPANMTGSDLLVSTYVIIRGYKLLFEPLAIGRERPVLNERDLFRRRVRIGAGNFEAIRLLAPLINPLNGFIPAWIFFSHKLLRWAAPFLMIAVYILNLALLGESVLYLILFILQNMFYLLAAATPLLKKIIKKLPLPLVAPHYFVTMNLALLAGFFKYLSGSQDVCWEKIR